MAMEDRVLAMEGQKAFRARPPAPNLAARPKERRLIKPPQGPTSRGDQSHPHEVGGRVAPTPGWSA